MALPQTHFNAHLFLHPRTAHLHARITLPLGLGLERWWEPVYCRVTEELTVAPLESDAGADMTFDFPNMSDQEQWMWRKLGVTGEGEGGMVLGRRVLRRCLGVRGGRRVAGRRVQRVAT